MNASPTRFPPLAMIRSLTAMGSICRTLASYSVGTFSPCRGSDGARLRGVIHGGQLTVLSVTQRDDLSTEVTVDELLHRHAQVHALDAHPDLVAARPVSVEPHAVVTLLTVGVVVEPTSGARGGQPDWPDLLEIHDPTGRQPVRRPVTRGACSDVSADRHCVEVAEDGMDRVNRPLSVVQGIEQPD